MPTRPVILGSDGKYWATGYTPATLSSGALQTAATTTATVTVDSDKTGTLYWSTTVSATPPSYADIAAGTGAVDYGSAAVAATGTQTISIDSLVADSAYYVHCYVTHDNRNSGIYSVAFRSATGVAPDVGLPVAIDVTGYVQHAQSITIVHDGVHTFGAAQGTVWISSLQDWGAAGAVTQEQTVTAWSDSSITVTVSATAFGGANADLTHKFLIVRDSGGTVVPYTAHDGRAIRSEIGKLGVNLGFTRYYAGVYHFRNIAKSAPPTGGSAWITPKAGTYTVDANGWLTNASNGAKATLRIYAHGDDPPSAEIYGRYVVSWSGSAKSYYGTSSTVGGAYSASQYYLDIDANTDNIYLWFYNDSGGVMADFVSDITMIRIDDQVGATDADKATAALADYAAGLAAMDERIFNPRYLTTLAALNPNVLRFMDWCGANGNNYPDWDQRMTMDVFSWGLTSNEYFGNHEGWVNRMVPWEVVFALARYIQPEVLWVNLPVRATDAHVASFAALLESEYGTDLAAGRKIIVEVGNELWNTASGFHMCSAIADLQWGLGKTLLEATYDGSTGTYTLAGHGLSNTDEIYAISGSTDSNANGTHPAVGLVGVPMSNPRYRYLSNVTTDTFELVDFTGAAVPPETAGAGTLRFYTTWNAGNNRNSRFDAVRDGAVARQCQVLKILKDNLVANSWAGVYRTLVFRDNTTANAWISNLQTWYDSAEYADIGAPHAIAGAPYIRNFDSAVKNQATPVWDDATSYQLAIDYLSSYVRFSESLRGALFTANKDWSADGPNIKILAYEGGLSGSEELTESNQAAQISFALSQYGADILAYSLKNLAASGELKYYCYYSDVRQGSIFALRESMLVESALSTYWESLGGEI